MTSKFEKILIHDYVSRTESIKRKLSCESWNRGVGSFFSDGVPFAFSTGLEFASLLVEYVEAIMTVKKESVKIAELGAGLGYLSKHIADILYEKDPSSLAKIQFEVSDSAPALVEQMQGSEKFKLYRKIMSFACRDAVSPDFRTNPDLVIMAYLLDSLETRHIVCKEGKIFERLVRSEWTPYASVFNTLECPPVGLSGDEIKSLLYSNWSELKRVQIRKLVEGIEESYRDVPLEETQIAREEKELIEAFIKKCGHKNIEFNSSYDAYLSLKNLAESQVGVIAIYDVGLTEDPNVEPVLCGYYGATQFYPISLSFIEFIAEKLGYKMFKSPFASENGQITLLVQEKYSEVLKRSFDQTMCNEPGEASRLAGERIQAILIKDPGFQDSCDRELAHLNAYEKQSHTLLMSLAIAYKRRGEYETALFYANQVTDLYGEMAISSWHLIAELYYYMGKYQEGLSAVNVAIKQAPDYVGSYHVQSLIYAKKNETDLAIKASENVVKYAGLSPLGCSHLYTVILLELSLKNREKAKKLLCWVLESAKVYPGLFSKTYLQTIEGCYKEFFRFGVQNAPPPPK